MKSKGLAGIFAALVALCLAGCGGGPGPVGTPVDTSDCGGVKLTWMTVSTTYDRDTVAKLAGEFNAAASADADKVKALESASADVKFTPELSRVTKLHEEGEATVSQEFYQQATAYRTSVCDLERLLDRRGLTEAQSNRVVDNLIDISTSFASIEAAEKKSISEGK